MADGEFMYSPALHGVQVACPDRACALPGAHGWQLVMPVTLLNEPALQPMHAAAPADGEYEPVSHALQFVWPGADAK